MTKKLTRLRKRFRRLSVISIVVAFVALFFVGYFIGNGFSLNDMMINTNDEFQVWRQTPDDGQTFFVGDDIEVTGMVVGKIPSKVYVWDEQYNVPVLATITGTNFGVILYADDLSIGTHTLCLQAQSEDGFWSPVQKFNIIKQGGTPAYESWSVSSLPSPISGFFRPVEEIVANLIIIVSGGTSPDDLNGDNIQDVFQQSPATPRYNPINVPMTALIVFVVIAIIVIMIIGNLTDYAKTRQAMEKELRRKPQQQKFIYKMKALGNKQSRAKLRKEREQRKRLENKLKAAREKELEAKEAKALALSKRPIKIYMNGKQQPLKIAPKKKSLWSKIRGK